MDDLIRRTDFKKMSRKDFDSFWGMCYRIPVKTFDELPAVDAVEQRHGTWHRSICSEDSRIYYCSVCDALNDKKTKYCPNCGAKMDGET